MPTGLPSISAKTLGGASGGGPAAVDPGGVSSRSTEDGAYFKHHTDSLIGVVPHVDPDRDE